ncbi:ribosome recycling factor [candidate division KSB1 bacterium]|nr:ribosome recycling factor [candidate division KSB1 bacterium]
MINRILDSTKDKMEKSIENLRYELTHFRTGKANPSLLDSIKVNYYGSIVPLKQAANIGVPEARLLTIQPWDKSMINEIEKAIQKSDLGLTPNNDGHIIRLPIPQLTEERRQALVKQAKKLGEETKISIRNARRDANDSIKKAEKDKDISEDESHRTMDEVQTITDDYIKRVDEILKKKEAEILEI